MVGTIQEIPLMQECDNRMDATATVIPSGMPEANATAITNGI